MAQVLAYHTGLNTAVLHEVATVVQAGGVIAIPTESSYGLGVSPFQADAVERLCRLKERTDGKPILVLIAARSQLDRLVRDIPLAAYLLMEAFWPGPLTIVFPAAASLPAALTAGSESVGVRWTIYRPLVDILRVTGPLTGTSANRAGRQPAQTAEAVQALFGTEVDIILDAGSAPGGAPSTVVDAREPVTLIREGPITREALRTTLQRGGFQLNIRTVPS